jgi:SAM-dependent methyltransferase
MGDPIDLSLWYGAHYFRNYRGAPYERSSLWLTVMNAIADGIVREFDRPRTVLDVGCAFGFLVEALRDRGVDAFGLDLSPYAIGQVHDSVKEYCWVASILDPLPERYDLIVCHEMLEHLPPGDANAAIARMCGATDEVLFSSTPDGYDEDTHLNVQPVDYWASLFAQHGFLRDLAFNPAGFLSPWACRFRRASEPLHRTVSGYERRVWTLSCETTALRTRVMAQAATIGRLEEAARERPETAALERTVEEQKEHLDALTDRLAYMTDREADMRRLLLDSHEQLLQRDQALQSRFPPAVVLQLQTLVDERTAWAQRAVEELETSRAAVTTLQTTVDERTTWAQQTVADMERAHDIIAELRATVDARTAWAQQAVAELDTAREAFAELRATIDARTAWAQQAVAELETARAVIDEQRRELDSRAAAAEALRAEVEQQVEQQRQIAQDHARTIEAIIASRTWRAGAPLRRMRQLLVNRTKGTNGLNGSSATPGTRATNGTGETNDSGSRRA